MKPYVLFFNPANRYNVRQPEWHPDTPDPFVDEWIVGELWGEYITENCIDDSVNVFSHHPDVESAAKALVALVMRPQ